MKTINVLTLAILMLLLTACASEPVTRTVTEYRYPPEALMRNCPMPVYAGQTWGEVAVYAVQLRESLRGCNGDKAALREWASE